MRNRQVFTMHFIAELSKMLNHFFSSLIPVFLPLILDETCNYCLALSVQNYHDHSNLK